MYTLSTIFARVRNRARRDGTALILFVSAVTLSVLFVHCTAKQSSPTGASITRREEIQDCHLVHAASDKCKFVQEYCPDEEAGIFSYLQLYYCTLPHVQGIAFIIIALWLCLLFSTIGIAASDFFSVNLSTISALLGLSENLAGVTFLAFGNGSPDVFSTFAAMSTHSGSLAVGELIGAAGFITAVVSGSMALVRPFEVARSSFVRDVVFFICAAIIAMVFLLDGQLMMWECVLMIAFYLLYVVVVVAWHWASGRRTARRAQEAAARQQFSTSPSDQNVPPSVDRVVGTRGGSSGDVSRMSHEEQFRLLESAGLDNDEAEIEERSRRLAVSEISQNMRVNRARLGSRRTTRNTIRPSLVGALEFRAVLSSLEKSRNQQTTPINLRRYSDDPTLRQFQRRNLLSPAQSSQDVDHLAGSSQARTQHLSPYSDGTSATRGRNRAASTNDIAALDPSTAETENFADLRVSSPNRSNSNLLLGTEAYAEISTSPQTFQPESSSAQREEHLLGGAGDVSATPQILTSSKFPGQDPQDVEEPRPGISRRVSSGLLLTPGTTGSSPSTPFPHYADDPAAPERPSRTSSIKLPSPILGINLAAADDAYIRPSKRLAWWPYKLLPAPQDLFSTLFPTVYSWPERNAWERLVGIVAAPSVFLLTITLPVVEERAIDDDEEPKYEAIPEADDQDPTSSLPVPNPPLISIEGPSETQSVQSLTEIPEAPTLTSGVMDAHAQDLTSLNSSRDSPSIQGWSRWLVCTQIVMAPLFVSLILWANVDADLSLRNLALTECYAMIGAMLVLALTLYTTTADQAPRFRPILSFAGFVVSVAWISTIANEVVGVLKALGVIFGISDAILGLTIFAVGNSLGDLVADVTVAKLGYPVMALGACIGGPMLNILLGIGIGGLYMTIREAGDQGPDGSGFAPYHIQVGGTLIVSSVALLITLAGLLVVVPMNKWIMDRKIGLGLIALWCVSTIISVGLEVSGTVTTV